MTEHWMSTRRNTAELRKALFGAKLTDLMDQRDVTVQALARQVPCDKAQLSRYRTGQHLPSATIVARLDELLGAGGELVALTRREALTNAGAIAPLAIMPGSLLGLLGESAAGITTRHRIDDAGVDALANMLAAYRAADDSLGSLSVLPAARSQLTVIERLVTTTNGPTRAALLDVGQQWSQFAAWLCRDSGDLAGAHVLHLQTLEWATEIDDRTMMGTVLVESGYAALQSNSVRTATAAGQAAQRHPGTASGQRAGGAQLEARAYALMGDFPAMERTLGRADRLVELFGDHPQDRRPWAYWMSPTLFTCDRGVVLAAAAMTNPRYCVPAAAALKSGHAALPESQRSSAWGGLYLAHLANVHAKAGDLEQSVATALTCADIANRTGSPRLITMLTQLNTGLARRYPGDPRVTALTEALT
jgi:transcriptional regulator with XRE-family HTH domain